LAVVVLATAVMVTLCGTPARSAATGAALPSTAVSGNDDLWHNQSVLLSFTASDTDGPGIAYTEYSLDAGSLWAQGNSATIGAPSDHANDGVHTVLYRSVDTAGNAEVAKSVTVKIDTSAPTSTIGGLPSGWVNHPVAWTLSATDDLSGIASSEYMLNGGAWTAGNPLTISAPGTTTVSCRSTDNAGNSEAAGSAAVRIDTSIPTASLYAASVRYWGMALLRFCISDAAPSCGAANLTIAVTLNGRTLKTIRLAGVPTGKTLSASFRCTLTPGRYRWSLSATDLAGNRAASASAALVVAPADQRVEKALRWALAQQGRHGWDYLCLRFVNDAYQNAGVMPRRWYWAMSAARALGAFSHKGVPPRGAYVFYWHPPYGHVGLSLGDGRIVHAFGSQGVIVSNYLRIHMTYIGWAAPKTTPQVSLGV
jgi:cell wall-associated NlpC family hydrolase